MKNLGSILIWTLATSQINAENIKTIKGEEYKNVKILSLENDKVRIRHLDGIGSIKIDQLSPASMEWLQNEPKYKHHLIDVEMETRRLEAEAEKAKKELEEKIKIQQQKNEALAKKEEKEKQAKLARDLTIMDEYERISSLKELWVDDFRTLEKHFNEEEIAPLSFNGVFIQAFGKPDHERAYTTPSYEWAITRDGLEKVRGLDARITEYTYVNRLKNPVTDKKEDLVLQFSNGFYLKALASPSGNESRK